MGIPSHTRIILIPDNNKDTREYGITRAMVVTLILLIVAMGTLTGLLMYSFAGKHEERLLISELEIQLEQAQQATGAVSGLRSELYNMRQTQEKLLLMLGVESIPSDSLLAMALEASTPPGSNAEALSRAAAVSLSPVPSHWPAAGYVTREFVEGNAPRGIKPHLGLDIAGATDTPIRPAAPGVVARVGQDPFLGNFVEIQHGLGYLTVYGHCSRVAVNKGDQIDGGQIVAYMGKSGQATATHLHFEVWQQGQAINPRELLSGDPPQN